MAFFTERRSYLDTADNLTSLIEHGDSINFFCKDDRFLTDSLYPGNTFSVKCNNGEMEPESLWPEEKDVSTLQ